MYEVISEFVDRRTGKRICPGHPVPEGMPEEALGRLVRAKCLKRLPAQAGLLGNVDPKEAAKAAKAAERAAAKEAAKAAKAAERAAAKEAAKAAKAAEKKAAGEGGSSQAGFLPDDDPSAVAGGDNDDPGQRAEPDGGGRGKGKG